MDKKLFEETFIEIKTNALNLFREQFKNTATNAIDDVGSFMEESKGKIEGWTFNLAKGDIDEGLFKQFISNQHALLQMKLLTYTGLAKIKVDRFQNALKKMIINTLLDKFLPML